MTKDVGDKAQLIVECERQKYPMERMRSAVLDFKMELDGFLIEFIHSLHTLQLLSSDQRKLWSPSSTCVF